ncbi:hypothetical protein CYMTET_34703 [Cymbomonas tetramitiformis]|uniref:Uncharacterized protein n=1 Tax=Cymbomonas tetramitiformis TaxID=36881 RepID=A0AAE0FAF9_9CHLO|nr:hypothetical protein CYMTET_34703 [Cymbomonas tetramitiformis]
MVFRDPPWFRLPVPPHGPPGLCLCSLLATCLAPLCARHAAVELAHRRRCSTSDKLIDSLAWCLEQAEKEDDVEELQSLRSQLALMAETLPSASAGGAPHTAKVGSVDKRLQRERRLVKAAAAVLSRQASSLSELEQCSQAIMSLSLQTHDIRREARLTLQQRQQLENQKMLMPKSLEGSVSNCLVHSPGTDLATESAPNSLVPESAGSNGRANHMTIVKYAEPVRAVHTVRVVPVAHATSGHSTLETAPSWYATAPSSDAADATTLRSSLPCDSGPTVASIPIRTSNSLSAASSAGTSLITSVH